MLVMTLVVTLQNPVFGYCFCLDAFFTGDCVCESAKQAATTAAAPSCQSCCAKEETSSAEQPSGPCDDCTERLSIDTGDFLWSGPSFASGGDTPDHTDFSHTPENRDAAVQVSRFLAGGFTRGVPPPRCRLHAVAAQGRLPIFLRHSVLRL